MRPIALSALDGAGRGEVRRLIARATAADDRSPVSEETLLQLRAPATERIHHILVRGGDDLLGYSALLPTDGPRPMVAELAVDPDARHRGVGRILVEALLAEAGDGGLSLWAHGRNAPAAALAKELGFDRQRTLLQLRRSLTSTLGDHPLPAGFRVEHFRAGADEIDFLAANAAAFVDLPDQGGWGPADLAARLDQPWFDPEGFLLLRAEDGDEIAGFHWTKLHRPDPLGEIYVLAITPPFQGRGLAPALAVQGLRHLRAAGATTAMLYVDATNLAALGLYRRLGFTEWDVDTLYTARSTEPR